MAQVDIDLGLATETTLKDVRDRLPSKDAIDQGAIVHVANELDIKDDADRVLGKVSIDGGLQTDGLTAAELHDEALLKDKTVSDLVVGGKLQTASDPRSVKFLDADGTTLRDVSASRPLPTTDAGLGTDGDNTVVPLAGSTGARGWLRSIYSRLTTGIEISDKATRVLGKVTSDQLPLALTNNGRLAVELPAGGSNTNILATVTQAFTASGQSVVINSEGASTVKVVTEQTSSSSTQTYRVEGSIDGSTWYSAQWWEDAADINFLTYAKANIDSAVAASRLWNPGSNSNSRSIKVACEGFKLVRITSVGSPSGINAFLLLVALREQSSVIATIAGTVKTSTDLAAGAAATILSYKNQYTVRTGALAANTAVALSSTVNTTTGNYDPALVIFQFNSDIALTVSVQHGVSNAANGTWRDIAAPVTLTGSAATGYSAQLMFYAPNSYIRPYVFSNASAAAYCDIYAKSLGR